MKKIFTLLSALAITQTVSAQSDSLLCNFDGQRVVMFKDYDGVLDTNFTNPNTVGNASAKCGRYIRKATEFDNLKVYPYTKFVDISNFAQANTTAKMSMKVLSKMPAGTKIDVQLGSRTDQGYPGGIHSIYTGTTTMVNQWETIYFTLSLNLSGSGGFPYPGSIDKLVILFNSGSKTATDTVYFDDIRGPKVEAPTGINEQLAATFKVSQNVPNPAKDFSVINIEMGAAANVSVVVYDLLGKEVTTLHNGSLSAGNHAFSMNTENMPNGVYFYTVKKGELAQTMKMVVAK